MDFIHNTKYNKLTIPAYSYLLIHTQDGNEIDDGWTLINNAREKNIMPSNKLPLDPTETATEVIVDTCSDLFGDDDGKSIYILIYVYIIGQILTNYLLFCSKHR